MSLQDRGTTPKISDYFLENNISTIELEARCVLTHDGKSAIPNIFQIKVSVQPFRNKRVHNSVTPRKAIQ